MKTQRISPVYMVFVLVALLFVQSGMMRGAEVQDFSLQLKAEAVVSDAIIRVKDIMLMDADTRARIGHLVVAVAPEMGNTTSIGKNEILEKLIGNGFSVSPDQLRGAASVRVSRQGMTVAPTFFKERIHDYIVANSRWKDGVSVTIESSKSIIVPETGVSWELTPANGQDFFGNILFKIRAISNATGEEVYANWLVAKLQIMKRVPVSNRQIEKNEPLTAENIRWETREITAFNRDALLEETELNDQRAGRIIRPNSVITTSLLEKKFLVMRGQTATLVAKLGDIKATSSVTVLSDGTLGDHVRVMNNVSKVIVAATVIGKNQLEVNVQ